MNNLDSFLSNDKSREMEYLFSIDLSNLVPLIKDATNMNYMFKGCKNLKYINFGKFDASKVTSMISIFEGCTSLISINLSNFDTLNVIDMSGLFNNLISLKELDISNFNMEKVVKYDNMFNNLSNLKYINIYNFKNEKNKIIYNTFKNMENLIVCQNEKIISNPNAIYKCCGETVNGNNQKKLNIKRLTDEIFDEKIELVVIGFNYYQYRENNLLFDFYVTTINNNVNFKLFNGTFTANCFINKSTETENITCIFVNYTTINNKYKISFSCLTSLTDWKDLYDFIFDPNNFEVVGASPLDEIIPENPAIVEALESFHQIVFIFEVFLDYE